MKFEIYKQGQGKNTRLGSAIGVGIVVALGCLQLYRKLDSIDTGLWVKTMVPTAVFIALGLLVFWLVNKVNIADFMIAAEGEMKKVNWSSRREIAVSTFVVIVVVIVTAMLLGITDLVFQLFFSWILK